MQIILYILFINNFHLLYNCCPTEEKGKSTLKSCELGKHRAKNTL